MQDIIRNNPFLRLLIPFLAGILLGAYFNPSFDEVTTYIIYILIGIWGFTLLFAINRFIWLQDLLIISIFFLFGVNRSADAVVELQQYEDEVIFSAQISDYPDSTKNSLKLELDLGWQITDSGRQEMRGNAFVYLSKEDSMSLDLGDYLLLKAKPDLIANQGNPGEFDFSGWAASKGFFYQFYVNGENWVKLNKTPDFNLSLYLKRLRRQIFNYYRKSGISDKQLAVFSALTLGDKSMLEHDLRQGYVAAGLMHVLAVSGLHVGIIYLVISHLLKPLSNTKWGKLLRFMISVFVLWGYAMFTGMSPSVSRAATMFTVFVFGDLLGRRYAVYNSIALAAFILLFNNPLLIASVGFQMSFLAVIGIVGFYPIVYRWIYIPWKPLDKIWQLMAVSIAAQIITTPLSLYYFHQFPLLFLLSNLLMVPLATLLMYLFVLLLVFMPFPFIALSIGQAVDFFASLMNAFTGWIKALDWSTVNSVYISDIQLVLLYLLVAVSTYWGIRTNYRNLKKVFIVLFLFVITVFWQNFIRTNNHSFIVFNTFGEPLTMQISGQNYKLYNPDSIENTTWFTDPLTVKFGLNQSETRNAELVNSSPYVVWGKMPNRAIFFDADLYPKHEKIKCKWLVLSSGSPFKLLPLLDKIEAVKVIADASVSQFKLEKWQEQLKDSDIDFHNVKRDGAFVAKW
ncbi:MAG TPA: ComEC/Rec2 family competence protein [Salinivirga sp.]|uniref:ComEC/Rec2 family competence protein n=1 Tax=Salinivirga sp. TaxID=1970192 RepID=UPI002B48D300|nr:ComEC/Rec2 family competence protein [Salinivirga sp.]HKK59928.1 ComEC/Rec2 family competence protein [Salinivirga sp.]